jgi:hypothetical protein
MNPASRAQLVFKPGDVVPHSGQYWIRHQQHRLTHVASISFSYFPECLRCGGEVRFIAAVNGFSNAPSISGDRDFK